MLGVSHAGMLTKNIRMTMNVISPTCTTAVVSNVDFGQQYADDIINGNIQKTSRLSIDCSSGGVIPSNITLKLIPAQPHQSFGNEGYIQASGRDDVGYRILWGDDKVGLKGQGVPMNKSVMVKKLTSTSDDILFDVKPVAYNKMGKLKPGAANTHITIKVTYS